MQLAVKPIPRASLRAGRRERGQSTHQTAPVNYLAVVTGGGANPPSFEGGFLSGSDEEETRVATMRVLCSLAVID